MKRASVEIMVGFFMLLGIVAILILAFKISGLSQYISNHGYTITASFQNIGDLKVRAPVTLAGVKVGEVSAINLDSTTFEAVVSINMDSHYDKIPVDNTAVSIYTAGLLGSNYISIAPGYGETYLKNGDHITNTQPALVLEQLIGQLLFKLKGDDNKLEESH